MRAPYATKIIPLWIGNHIANNSRTFIFNRSILIWNSIVINTLWKLWKRVTNSFRRIMREKKYIIVAYEHRCFHIEILLIGTKLNWHLKLNTIIVIQEETFKNKVCKVNVIFSLTIFWTIWCTKPKNCFMEAFDNTMVYFFYHWSRASIPLTKRLGKYVGRAMGGTLRAELFPSQVVAEPKCLKHIPAHFLSA